MTIPINVTGLDTILPAVEKGKIVVVESGVDPAKGYLVRRLALSAASAGDPYLFITSRGEEETRAQLVAEREKSVAPEPGPPRVVGKSSIKKVVDLDSPASNVVVVDSFSLLTLGLTPEALAQLLYGMRERCQTQGTTYILSLDQGMLDPRADAVIGHLCDGMIQFHSKDGGEGVFHFLRVPKWTDGRLIDRNIYYEFDGRRLLIDLRRRVL